MKSYAEDHLVEQPAIQFMEHKLSWDSRNAYNEWAGGVSLLGCEMTPLRHISLK